jgi:hypothetical protein
MAAQVLGTANNYTLQGGSIEGNLTVTSFSGMTMTVETTSNSAGNTKKGDSLQQSRPGKKTYGEPTFTCPIIKGNMKLWKWWTIFHPTNGKQGKYEPEDLTFTFQSEGEVLAEWQIIGAFPKGYEPTGGSVEDSTLAAVTLTICCKDIIRRK